MPNLKKKMNEFVTRPPEAVCAPLFARCFDLPEEEAREIIATFAPDATALIFDVRFNPGGYADELVKVLDHLLPEGRIFHTIDYTGKEEFTDSDAQCLEMPMAVLVNESSYSAAELFAAALSEYDWAVVVGEATTGKSY